MESRLGKLAVEALFPRFCIVCKREGALTCRHCFETWTPVPQQASCAFCGTPGSPRTCASCREETYLDGLSFFAPYGNASVRELLGAWKYNGDRSAEATLETWLRRASTRMEPPAFAFYSTSVPLHKSRRRERGFDQAETLSSWVGEIFGIPHETFLIRKRKTSPQARTSHDERRVGEMDGAFAVLPGVDVPAYVLLCDDVFTSGATMDAAARALKEAGAKTVWGFVIARG